MKIVINSDYGGYCLSDKACEYLGVPIGNGHAAYSESRRDPKLIDCVEKLGKEASGECSSLKVIGIPDDMVEIDEDGDEIENYHIHEYDGKESVRWGQEPYSYR